jgi:hypothetical protein
MENAAISFLDILGFKGIWQSRKSDDVLKLLDNVENEAISLYRHPPPKSKWPKSEPPKVTILSDTIVIVIKSEEPHCLLLLANLVYGLFAHFFESNLFLRGAVTWGKYSQSKSGSSFIGPAIDDVASWYEESNWIGAVLTPKTNYLMDLFPNFTMGVNGYQVTPYIKYNVPSSSGNANHLYSVNWPAYLEASYKNLPTNKNDIKTKKFMYNLFSKQSDINKYVLEKYENTIQFIEYSAQDFTNHNS